MAKQSSVNLDITNNADGFDVTGGTTPRKLTLSGGDVSVTGSGSATLTFPSTTDTLVGRATTDTLTNKTLTSPILTTPVLGTPTSGTLTNCTGLPVAGITSSTSTALGVGSLELGHASDTTLTRSSAGVIAVEGVVVPTVSSTSTFTNKTLTKPTINGSIPAVTNATDGATVTFDLSASNIHTVTLGGNRTLALSNVSTGQVFMVELTQDGTGGRTVIWFSTIKWAGGTTPTLTATANKRDVFGFRCTGSGTYDGYIIGQNI